MSPRTHVVFTRMNHQEQEQGLIDETLAEIVQAQMWQREYGTGGLEEYNEDLLEQIRTDPFSEEAHAEDEEEDVVANLDDNFYAQFYNLDQEEAVRDFTQGLLSSLQTEDNEPEHTHTEDNEPAHAQTEDNEAEQGLGGATSICKQNKSDTHRRCKHNRRVSQCKECGGSQICEHGRFRSRCKECGGSQICEHGINKAYCKDCKGSQICQHLKQKRRCEDCRKLNSFVTSQDQVVPSNDEPISDEESRQQILGEIQAEQTEPIVLVRINSITPKHVDDQKRLICTHGRVKYYCVECGGSQSCTHGYSAKSNCIICCPHLFCPHGRRRNAKCYQCQSIPTKDNTNDGGAGPTHPEDNANDGGAGPSAIKRDKYGHIMCEHGRVKRNCKDCKGSNICTHGKLKYYCRDCGGSQTCPHDKSSKSCCATCSPHLFCRHGRRHHTCRECNAPPEDDANDGGAGPKKPRKQ